MSFTYVGDSKHCENDSKIGKSGSLFSRENSIECSYSRFSFVFNILIICLSDSESLDVERYLNTTHYTIHTTHYTLHTTHYTLHTTHCLYL